MYQVAYPNKMSQNNHSNQCMKHPESKETNRKKFYLQVLILSPIFYLRLFYHHAVAESYNSWLTSVYKQTFEWTKMYLLRLNFQVIASQW